MIDPSASTRRSDRVCLCRSTSPSCLASFSSPRYSLFLKHQSIRAELVPHGAAASDGIRSAVMYKVRFEVPPPVKESHNKKRRVFFSHRKKREKKTGKGQTSEHAVAHATEQEVRFYCYLWHPGDSVRTRGRTPLTV